MQAHEAWTPTMISQMPIPQLVALWMFDSDGYQKTDLAGALAAAEAARRVNHGG